MGGGGFLWKEELVKILFSNDPTKLNPKKAINLKYENTPSSLYKYKPFDNGGHSLELLKTDKMRLSRPNSFNDPFDCAIKLVAKDMPNEYIIRILEPYSKELKQKFNLSDKELYKLKNSKKFVHDLTRIHVKKTYSDLTLKERNKRIDELERDINNSYVNLGLKKNFHVSCFSETKESILMWSHYANNHEGFCVEYNFKELGLNNLSARFVFPVIYTESVFDIKGYLPDSNKEFNDILKEYTNGVKKNKILDGIKHPERDKGINNMALFYNALNKYKDWSYEKEWRYVFPYKNSKNRELYLDMPKPKAIYLGAMVSEENCKKILRVGRERNINVYKMDIKPSEFALESKRID